MAHYSVSSKLSPEKVMEKALAYFGELGLTVEEQEPCCAYLVGGGGHIRVSVAGSGRAEVDVETREWDYQVKEFLQRIV